MKQSDATAKAAQAEFDHKTKELEKQLKRNNPQIGNAEIRSALKADPEYRRLRDEKNVKLVEYGEHQKQYEQMAREQRQQFLDKDLKSVKFESDIDVMREKLKNFPIKEAALFDSLPDGRVTAKILADRDIGLDYYAVRIQRDEFTDLVNHTISGHQNPKARVLDYYHPTEGGFGQVQGKHTKANAIASRDDVDALNVVLVRRPAKLVALEVVACFREGVFAAQFRNRHPSLCFPQKTNDLFSTTGYDSTSAVRENQPTTSLSRPLTARCGTNV